MEVLQKANCQPFLLVYRVHYQPCCKTIYPVTTPIQDIRIKHVYFKLKISILAYSQVDFYIGSTVYCRK